MSLVSGTAPGAADLLAPRADSGALAALRAATGADHRRVDGAMPLSRQSLDLADYVTHLEIIRAWLGPIDAWLGQYSDGPQDRAQLAPLPRLRWLDDDLSELRPMLAAATATASSPVPGASASSADIDVLGDGYVGNGSVVNGYVGNGSVVDGISGRPAEPGYRWGVCYVIEGSSLGGLVLGRRIAELVAGHRPRYLATDRETVARRWQRFRECLLREVREPAAIERACAGARAAFADLIRLIPGAGGPGIGPTAASRST